MRSSLHIDPSPLSCFDGSNLINGQPSRPAITFTKTVLTIPGGLNSNKVTVASKPTQFVVSGSASGATTRPAKIFFSSQVPETLSCNFSEKTHRRIDQQSESSLAQAVHYFRKALVMHRNKTAIEKCIFTSLCD